ncbi:MAG: glycoside hydrolase family 88 protein [Lachnospiraceae bacterium]
MGQNSMLVDEIHSGLKLFAGYAETKDAEVAKQIQSLMQQLKDAGTDMWNPALNPDWMKNLYKAMPFWMAYETVFHGKGNYLDILNIFRGIRSTMFDSEKHLYRSGYDVSSEKSEKAEFMLRDSACMMMIFVDVMTHMSIEIFEQYKEIEGFLKETLKGILASPEMMAQIAAYKNDDCEDKDVLGSVMLAYAILVGCRTLGALSAEHYEELGESILEALFDKVDVKEAADYISGRM